MEDINLLEAIERYFNNEMSAEEKAYFEELRKKNSEIDQMVIDHKVFLMQMDAYAGNKLLKHTLHAVHTSLSDSGQIGVINIGAKGKVIQFWSRYKKVAGIAASIAGITALAISGVISSLTPNNKNEIQQLNRDVQSLKSTQMVQSNKLNEVVSKAPKGAEVKSGGTGFIIDNRGYLVTNAHVMKSVNAIVTNNKGQEFNATLAYADPDKDIAILKITDKDFKPFEIPYAIKRSNLNLGQEIFTLGYPRNDIVYTTGYLSARSGYDGDTSAVQLSLPANPGNSGGPVFNENGDVVGILSSRETQMENVTFAIKSRSIYQILDAWRNRDTSANSHVRVSSGKGLKGMNREEQIAKLEDCVFLVKVYN